MLPRFDGNESERWIMASPNVPIIIHSVRVQSQREHRNAFELSDASDCFFLARLRFIDSSMVLFVLHENVSIIKIFCVVVVVDSKKWIQWPWISISSLLFLSSALIILCYFPFLLLFFNYLHLVSVYTFAARSLARIFFFFDLMIFSLSIVLFVVWENERTSKTKRAVVGRLGIPWSLMQKKK